MDNEWLDWVLRVQSVTWAAIVGCPCDRWWLVGVVLLTLCSQCQALGQALIPLPSRERGTEVVLSFMFGHGQVMVLVPFG